jgi:hypothetical protein
MIGRDRLLTGETIANFPFQNRAETFVRRRAVHVRIGRHDSSDPKSSYFKGVLSKLDQERARGFSPSDD